MDPINGYLARMTLYYKIVHVLGALIFLIGVIFSVRIIIEPGIPHWNVILFTLICSLGGFYGITTVINIFKIRLFISENGLIYERIFFRIQCKWEDIEKFSIGKDHFILICNTPSKKSKYWFTRIFYGFKHEIPLQFFVRKWGKYSDWERDPVLVIINQYKPGLLMSICNS